MRLRKLVLASMIAALLPAVFCTGPARADMSGDANFCYVGWVWKPRYGFEEDKEGRVTQVRLGGMILVCPTDLN